jgi:hypothetical protein
MPSSRRVAVPQIHVVMQSRFRRSITPDDGAPRACFRCERSLPQDQFHPVGTSANGAILYLHPFCVRCRNQLKTRNGSHPKLSPSFQSVVKQMVNGLRAGAAARGIVFAIDEDDVCDIWLQQDGRCALTGIEMTCGKRDKAKLSVDRIDSAANYTRDNVQLVCAAINVMKNDMPQNVFQAWCRAVVRQEMRAERALEEAVA